MNTTEMNDMLREIESKNEAHERAMDEAERKIAARDEEIKRLERVVESYEAQLLERSKE